MPVKQLITFLQRKCAAAAKSLSQAQYCISTSMFIVMMIFTISQLVAAVYWNLLVVKFDLCTQIVCRKK